MALKKEPSRTKVVGGREGGLRKEAKRKAVATPPSPVAATTTAAAAARRRKRRSTFVGWLLPSTVRPFYVWCVENEFGIDTTDGRRRNGGRGKGTREGEREKQGRVGWGAAKEEEITNTRL